MLAALPAWIIGLPKQSGLGSMRTACPLSTPQAKPARSPPALGADSRTGLAGSTSSTAGTAQRAGRSAAGGPLRHNLPRQCLPQLPANWALTQHCRPHLQGGRLPASLQPLPARGLRSLSRPRGCRGPAGAPPAALCGYLVVVLAQATRAVGPDLVKGVG